jgi:type IV secretion system protein VirD4
MSVRPSDISRPRDDSMMGTARRVVTWTVLIVSVVAVLLVGVQLASLIDGTPHPAFTIRGSLGQLADLVKPDEPLTRKVALVGGLVVIGLLVGSVATAIGGRVLKESGLAEQDRQMKAQLDGAQWATHDDIAPLLVQPGQQHNRVVLGYPRGTTRRPTGELAAVEPGHSALVVAPTGQGKTESVMAPAIMDWDGPVVAISIKRDLYDLTAGHRATQGEVRVLDPAGLTDPTEVRHAYWNPLPASREWRAARLLADQMAGVGQRGAQQSGAEQYFAEASGQLLAGLFFAAAHSSRPSMQTVSEWLEEPDETISSVEDVLSRLIENDRAPEDARDNAVYAMAMVRLGLGGHDPRSVEQIRRSAAGVIRSWNDHRLGRVKVTDPGVLQPDWLWAQTPGKWERRGPNRTLYILGPDAEQGTYEAMFVGAIAQIYNTYARAMQAGGSQTPPKRLLLVLDEVANTAPIPKLDTWVTAARGLGINLVIACQNLAQLDTVWGREKAETIVSGPRVRMFGPGLADPQTLRYIEQISGQTGVVSENESRNPFLLQVATSRQTQTTWRPLIPQNEAAGLQPFTALTFYGSLPPFQVDWRSAHTDPQLLAQQDLVAPRPEDDELEHLQTRPVGRRHILEDLPGPPADEAAELAEGEADEPTAEDGDQDAMPEDFDPGNQSDDLLLDDHLPEEDDNDDDDDDQGDDVALAA